MCFTKARIEKKRSEMAKKFFPRVAKKKQKTVFIGKAFTSESNGTNLLFRSLVLRLVFLNLTVLLHFLLEQRK
jgi:hypothetical protein